MKEQISGMTCPMCNQELPSRDCKPTETYLPPPKMQNIRDTTFAKETIQRLDRLEEHIVQLTAKYDMLLAHVKGYTKCTSKDWSQNKSSEPICIPETDRFYRQEP